MMEEKQEAASQELSKLELLKKFAFDFDSDAGKLNRQLVSTGNLFAAIGKIVIWSVLLISSFGLAIFYAAKQVFSVGVMTGPWFVIIASVSAAYLSLLFVTSIQSPLLRKKIFTFKQTPDKRDALKKDIGKYTVEYFFVLITPFVFMFLFVASCFIGLSKASALKGLGQEEINSFFMNYAYLGLSNFAFACLSLVLALIETSALFQNLLFRSVLVQTAIFNSQAVTQLVTESETQSSIKVEDGRTKSS